MLYPVEFLNLITVNSFSQHCLALKKGAPILLMHNLSQSEGPCNGTRLIVRNLADCMIQPITITGKNILPRTVLSTTNTRMPFTLQRQQFTIKVCYPMTNF